MTDAPASPRIKITYATLRNDNEELHRLFDAGLGEARALLGGSYRNLIDGAERDGDGTFEKRSPIDGTVIGTFARGTRTDVQDAIAAARAAYPAWAHRPWRERVELLRRAADLISERQMMIAAVVAMEVGKNRLEALGDVEETADLIRWSCDMVEQNDGFDHPMGNLGDPSVHTRSVLKPYGVWGIISPFNFPFALSGGPSGGALVAGNTVVYKPSSDTPLSGVLLTRVMRDAGLPDGVFNMVMGPGETVGQEIQTNPGVDGILFTGSFEVGYRLYHEFPRPYPKPVIVEMGGKNPTIVTAHADLDEAAEGVMRAAFGLSGQKCSANSRVYVERPVYDRFLGLLVDKTRAIAVGDPLDKANWMGPVINDKAVARYQEAAAEARTDGAIALGGERLTGGDYDQGFFVAPTIVTGLSTDHRLLHDELFLPVVVVLPVDSLDEALRLSNANIQGLTAGVYTEDADEQAQFLDQIEAGVVYVNRR
ncbi:MAG: aldehyde dehydrogenase family protein, partial [Chloroflexota bacterium]